MISVIYSAATRILCPLFFVLSLFVLYRGHNLPGGGFIGGLLAAVAIILRMSSEGPEWITQRAWFQPIGLMAAGLLLASLSAAFPVFIGAPVFEGQWLPSFSLPLLGTVHLGTPLIFDVGVYLVVVGFTAQAISELSEAN
ncbi:MAG: MnhB domain-containing protein [Opitutales bacterium]